MKTLIIPAGAHRPENRWPPFAFYWNKNALTEDYLFTESCRYTLPGADQHDWNKLTGLSFGFFPDKNSVRFVWRYNPDTLTIEIGYYIYENSVRVDQKIADINIPDKVSLFMYKDKSNVYFFVESGRKIAHATVPNLFWKNGPCIRLGLYFGGNQPAPHRIEIVKYSPPYI